MRFTYCRRSGPLGRPGLRPDLPRSDPGTGRAGPRRTAASRTSASWPPAGPAASPSPPAPPPVPAAPRTSVSLASITSRSRGSRSPIRNQHDTPRRPRRSTPALTHNPMPRPIQLRSVYAAIRMRRTCRPGTPEELPAVSVTALTVRKVAAEQGQAHLPTMLEWRGAGSGPVHGPDPIPSG